MKDRFINYGLGLGALVLITLIGVACLSLVGNYYPTDITESGPQADVMTGGIMQVGTIVVILAVIFFAVILTLIISKFNGGKNDGRTNQQTD
jgi:hypothetical protein